MSLNAMGGGGGGGGMPPGIDPKFIKADPDGAAVLIPMGITSENVASKFGIDRAQQVQYYMYFVSLLMLFCVRCVCLCCVF